MKRKSVIGLLGLGVGFLFLLGSSSQAEADELPRKQTEAAKDPLPGFALNQGNVVESIAALYETGDSTKLRSILFKSQSASVGMRAYVSATLAAIPERLKQDEAFRKDFVEKERERLQRLAEVEKNQQGLLAVVDGLAALLSVVVPAGSAIYGAAKKALIAGVAYGVDQEVPDVDVNAARSALAQIQPGREGFEVRKGVSLTPLLPYITKAEIELSDSVRRRWWQEMQADEDWQNLPSVSQNTTFRFSPKWDEWKAAKETIRGEQ